MKNLFSKSLGKKKWAVISASLVVFASTFGVLMYQGTKETVALTLDGEKKVIKTHADTIQEVFDDLNISIRSEDYVFPSGNTKVKDNLRVVWKPAKQVQMVVDNEKKTIWTTANTVEEVLKEQGIALKENDEVDPKPEKSIKSNMNITIQKAFQLTLNDGGKIEKVWTTSTTVADFLAGQGITLGQFDKVEPKSDTSVKENTVINVVRIEKVTDVVEEPISYAVVTKKDAKLPKGKEKIVSNGQRGLVSKEFEVILKNGKVVSRILKSEKKVRDKKDKVVAVGTKVMAKQVSRGVESGLEFYVNSTAYTANCNGCSGHTATGINLHNNPNIKVVAVDPRVIPLGTKLYVEGYGYAVAADTGSAVKGHKIDVFFSSVSEAYRWGRRTVKIKILK
ncbi:ubiquitin-like domain-containing protein [Bacillus sp. CGMCC 1.16607]|uniref:ubiquitin-like domain-containing protein n=1 Tax=Bacillus sp. CGMCC 1.16607 TaxID=3351842 RepID=UPI0036359043